MNERKHLEPEPPDVPIGDRAIQGFGWLTLQKWVIRILSFVTIAILTRFLRPADFGVVAAASSMLPFFYLLADAGFSMYIVQADHADDKTLSTGFWFSATAGIVLCGAFVATAPLTAAIFGTDDVVPILQVMSLCVVLTALGSVPTAILRRRMQFRALAFQGSAAAVIAQLVAIAMTLAGFGVWALVAQATVSQLVTCVAVWIAARWRPRVTFSGSEFVTMLRFGSQVLGVDFIAVARTWGEAAIVTATLGVTGLGYLNIAQRLIQIVQDLTGAAVIQVTTVAFARIRSSSDRLREAYLRALRTVYAVMAPPLTLIAVAAPLIVPVVFGDGWTESAGPAQILALAGIFTIGAQLDGSVFYGLGKPGRWFSYALVIDALTLGTTAVAVRWGLTAVAWGFLAVAVIATLSRWLLVSRLLTTTIVRVASPIGFLLAAVAASLLAGFGVRTLTASLPPLLALVPIGLAVLVAHILIVRWLAPGVVEELQGHLARFPWARRIPLLPKPKGQP